MSPEKMLDFLEENDHLVMKYGKTWYYRAGWGKPHRRAKSLRDAIIKASLAALQQGSVSEATRNGTTQGSAQNQKETPPA